MPEASQAAASAEESGLSQVVARLAAPDSTTKQLRWFWSGLPSYRDLVQLIFALGQEGAVELAGLMDAGVGELAVPSHSAPEDEVPLGGTTVAMNSLDYNSLDYVLGRGKLERGHHDVCRARGGHGAVLAPELLAAARRTTMMTMMTMTTSGTRAGRSLAARCGRFWVRAPVATTHDAVIPDDAEKINSGDQTAQALNLKKTKENPPDPDQPKGSEEKLLTPRAALVAPDVTPQSMTEIDPSEVPGQGNAASASKHRRCHRAARGPADDRAGSARQAALTRWTFSWAARTRRSARPATCPGA
jgi:hypothetical protein